MPSSKLKNNIPVLATATVYMAGIAGFLKFAPQIAENIKSFCDTLGIDLWIGMALLSIPLLITIALKAVNLVKMWWTQKYTVLGTEEANVYKHGYFRITPFSGSERDITEYCSRRRPDGLEEQLVDWLEGSDEPILFLTGKSGTGKSSILSAAVLPKLKEINPELNIVNSRIFNDPLDDIRQSLLKPGAIWKQSTSPPDDLLNLLNKAVVRSPLLLVIDQFEELLILHNEEVRGPMESVLRQIRDNPIKDLRILLVVRDDYLPQLGEADRYLPPLRLGYNWRQVGPFNQHTATQFIATSGTSLTERQISNLLSDVNVIEEVRGLYRPIILNMVGLALERNIAGKKRLPILNRQSLLSSLVEDEIGNDDDTRQILSLMVTEAGTKRPVAIEFLADTLKMSIASVKAILTKLSASGITRKLSQHDTNWEISHDFIARILSVILTRWKGAIFRKFKPWIAPAVSLILLIVMSYSPSQEKQIIAIQESLDKFFISLAIQDQERSLVIYRSSEALIEEQLELLIKYSYLASIDSLVIDLKEGSNLLSIPESIVNIRSLRKLVIRSRDNLRSLPQSIGQMVSLKELYISNNWKIKGLPETLAQLSSLGLLVIESNPSIKELPDSLGKLNSLEVLVIKRNRALTEIPSSVGELHSLRSFYIEDNPKLETLPDTLDKLLTLESLTIKENYNLKVLPNSIGGIQNLKDLVISGSHQLNLIPESLAQLQSLRSLEITNLKINHPLPYSLGNLRQLRVLGLRNIRGPIEIPDSLGELSQLETLEIGGIDSIQVFPESLGRLSQLKKLSIYSLSRPQMLFESLGHLGSLEDLLIERMGELANLPESIGELRSLKKLTLNNANKITLLPPSLTQLKHLEFLRIQSMNKLCALPQDLGNLESLEYIFIENNDCLDEIPESIGRLQSLKQLGIESNDSIETLPESLIELSSLEYLSVHGNASLIIPPAYKRELPPIKNIDFSNNGLMEHTIMVPLR